MSEHAEPPQSSGTSPDGSSPGEAVAEEWSDGDGDESSFGVSNDPATHGVADAAELLALREALSEKELQMLEMRQSMADEEEENTRALTSARKELAAKVRESAVRAKAKNRHPAFGAQGCARGCRDGARGVGRRASGRRFRAR